MSRDNIIQMAREAGARPQQNKNCDVEYLMSGEALERFAALVAEKEREECAKVCEANHQMEWRNLDSFECAAAIRARGNA